MALYDSAKAREAAAQIKQVAGSLDGTVRPGMQGVFDCIGDLRGKTAEAMEDRMRQLKKNADSLSEELGDLARKVNAYAVVLEQTDAKLADEM